MMKTLLEANMNIEVKTEWDESRGYNFFHTKATLEEFNTFIKKFLKDTSKDSFASFFSPEVKNNNVFIGRR